MPAKSDFSGVKTLLAIDNPIIRKGVWNLLQQDGFREFTMAATHIQLHEAISKEEFDLIVMVSDMGTMPISRSLLELRMGRFVSHPFPIVIVFAISGEHQDLLKQINYGPDSMLVIPVVPTDFLTRVRSFAQTRKPFVVTFAYIGPDRRKQGRDAAASAPALETPNPLKSLSSGQSRESLRRDVMAAVAALNRLKIKGNVEQIRWLGDSIRKARSADAESVGAEILTLINGYGAVADDIRLRTKDWTTSKFEPLLGAITETLESTLSPSAKIDKLSDIGDQVIREIERSVP